MNILYINPYAGGPGVGRYWRSYHLARTWLKDAHDVTVVSPAFHHLMDESGRATGSKLIEGVPYIFLPALRYKDNGIRRFLSMIQFPFSLFFYFITLLFKPKPDLIIYSSAHPFGYPAAWLAARVFGAGIYFEVRDIWPLSLVEVAGFSPKHPIVRTLSALEKFAYATADRVVSLLPGASSHMQSRGMAARKFIYVPNGFSESEQGAGGTEAPLLLTLDEFKKAGYFVFFYAGALGEPNAMHRFLDALNLFDSKANSHVKFVIAGRGEQAAELEQRCIAEGYGFVHFFPQQDKSVIHSALQYVDAGFFVMHDLPIYRFGISLNKLYDYMGAQLPVVAAYSACNDPVSIAECGVRVAPDDSAALAAAFQKFANLAPEDLKKMGRAGRAYMESNFEYSVLARKMLD